MGLEPVDKNVKININGNINKEIEGSTPILDFGVLRTYHNSSLELNISCNKFFSFILLREVYYRFIPHEINNPKVVKICINQIVENSLQSLPTTREWQSMILSELVDRDFKIGQLERLQKFFRLQAPQGKKDTIQYFYEYIYEHAMVHTDLKTFYDKLFNDYLYYSQALYDEDRIKTLSTLITIFHEDKKYRSIKDYTSLYRDLLNEGKIDSNLSVKKFNKNLQWINNFSSIAPSYLDTHTSIGTVAVAIVLTFNPLIDESKVRKVLYRLPFKMVSKFTKNSFALRYSAAFIIPKIYLQDFVDYINKLETYHYIIDKKLYLYQGGISTVNLNYFSDTSNRTKIIDPTVRGYNQKYEFNVTRFYPSDTPLLPLSLFEFMLITIFGNFSPAGLTFDKRSETLSLIKDDVESEHRKQLNYIKGFRSKFRELFKEPAIHSDFKVFLEFNKDKGFFFLVETLKSLLDNLSMVEIFLESHQDIRNFSQMIESLKRDKISHVIEENVTFKTGFVKGSLLVEITQKYFHSKDTFLKERKKYQLFYDLFSRCFDLKILNITSILKITGDLDKIQQIHKSKEKRISASFKEFSAYKITNQVIESTINKLVTHTPSVIVPSLINTIAMSEFAKYFPRILLAYSTETWNTIGKLQSYFPRVGYSIVTDLSSNEKLILVDIYCINIKEKNLFVSVLYSVFGENIHGLWRDIWKGLFNDKETIEDFYDADSNQLFYTKDLYEQLNLFARQMFGDTFQRERKRASRRIDTSLLWSKGNSMKKLIQTVKTRVSLQHINFTLQYTNRLVGFNNNLITNLLDTDKFIKIKEEDFFKTYVKSIRFIPAFSKFGFSKYYLYLLPNDWNEVDFKLMVTNTFQKIKYPAYIGFAQILYGTFLFPYKTPNIAHINWLLKSKKCIDEYCLFSVKRMYEMLHFDHSLSEEKGWQYSSTRFKTHVQSILFNTNDYSQLHGMRQFDVVEPSSQDIYGLDTPEFQALTEIYGQKSSDIKFYLGTHREAIINNIEMLLKKKLIFPYISLKNLDLQDKISLILPDINSKIIEKLLPIFSFFNVCHIYETEGEFFIKGFSGVRKFESGMLIEIFFPQCELSEFFDIFDMVFDYLDVKYYLTLTDLVKGEALIRNIFETERDFDYFESYNPLTNLKWNKKDKIWMNHKQYNEDFEPIYPDLFFGKKRDEEKKQK